MIHDVVPTTSYLTPLDSFNVFDLDGGGDISWVEFKVRARQTSGDAIFGHNTCESLRRSLRSSQLSSLPANHWRIPRSIRSRIDCFASYKRCIFYSQRRRSAELFCSTSWFTYRRFLVLIVVGCPCGRRNPLFPNLTKLAVGSYRGYGRGQTHRGTGEGVVRQGRCGQERRD